MPISEDDFKSFNYKMMESNSPTTTSSMSKAEIRKSHKPIMEKRRRAKINNCLNEIKDLILKAMKKDPERHSKLEKADILEMAVKHLKAIQQKQKEHAIRSDPNVAMKYKSGYVECAQEVTKYVNRLDGVETGLKQRLNNHLNECANEIDQQLIPNSNNQFPSFASSTLLASFAQAQQNFEKSFAMAKNDDQNNNNNNNSNNNNGNNRSIQGIELIPSCLPNGDFAFLVPKSSFTSILSQSKLEFPDRPSAFVTVTPKLHFRESQESSNDGHLESSSSGLLKISNSMLSPISSLEDNKPGFKIVKPKPEKAHNIQNIKFPIQKKDYSIGEPLCIITNGAERYRQAQKVDESRHNEENVYLMKRKCMDDDKSSLLGGIVHESKKFRPEIIQSQSSSSTISNNNNQGNNVKFEKEDAPSNNKECQSNRKNDDKNEPMWRPW